MRAVEVTASTERLEPEEIRRAFAARLREEGLTDYRLATLRRWVDRLPDERVADAVEMILVGLDAPRRARWEVLWVIERSFKRMDAIARETRLAFLRWVVASRAGRATVAARLRELEHTRPEKREAFVAALTRADEGSALRDAHRLPTDTRNDFTEARTRFSDTTTGADARPFPANAHPILVEGWRAAPPHARPHGEVHRGEHQPSIGRRGYVHVAAFAARKVAHLVPRGRRKAFERLVRLAEEAARSGTGRSKIERVLDDGAYDGALDVARSACAEARAVFGRSPGRVGVSARAAVTSAVGLLLRTDGHEEVRSFLEQLDAELRRLDIEHALALRRKQPTAPITGAVHRGIDGQGRPAIWIARLGGRDGRDHELGLLVKHGRLWTWSEGAHDDVLAMVPDEHFERAVMAAKRELRP